MPRDPSSARDESRALVGTPYRLVRRLGAGTMGEVFEAEHTARGVRRAIKLLAPHLTADARMEARMRAEARALAVLDHPNVVTVLESGVAEGRFYFVMPLLVGETLRAEMARGPVPLGRALRLATSVLDGLDAAHRLGIVHRDVKPENVHVGTEHVKLLDFGIAKLPADEPLTQSGVSLGTPRYMAPEQIRGQAVDARTDIYAVGVMLFEMLACVPPYAGTQGIAVATAHLQNPVPELSRDALGRPLPAALTAAITRALQKTPRQRFKRARELAAALRALRVQEPEGACGAFDEGGAILPTERLQPTETGEAATPHRAAYTLTHDGAVLVVRWADVPGERDVHELVGDIAFARETAGQPLLLVVVVGGEAPVPDAIQRDRIIALRVRLEPFVGEMHFVYEGEGFRPATQRAIVVEMHGPRGEGTPVRHHRTSTDAVDAIAGAASMPRARIEALLALRTGR